jgi:hypothetical protein
MKMRIKNSIGYFLFAVALCVMMISGCSLFYPKPTHDPLAGFHWSSLVNLDNNKTIMDDYESYLQKLSPDERNAGGYTEYFEDGTGQFAIKITRGLNGTNWRHVLIYDKDNKRIKTIKYVSGHSQS